MTYQNFKKKILQLKELFRKQEQIKRDHFLEILIETSFKTNFEVWYLDEFDTTQKIQVEGDKYSKIIYISKEIESISFRIFVQNPNRYDNEKLYLKLLQNDKVLEFKKYSISNYLPYDGWFFFEKKI
jgi:hypothetical protein